MIENVGDALVAQLLEGIRNDRLNTNQRTDMEHIIKGAIQSFVCVQEYKKKGSLQLYQQTFESPLLQDSGEFYKLEANRLLQVGSQQINVNKHTRKMYAGHGKHANKCSDAA